MSRSDRRRRVVRALAAAACVIAAHVPSAARGAPPLRWGADAEGGAPYVALDPDDPSRQVGFEVEIAAALGRRLGRPVDFVQYDYGSLLAGLGRRDIDLAMNGLEVTPDRAVRVRFSRPYYRYRLELVVRRDGARCDTWEACRAVGATIGTLGDTAAERLLDAEGVKKRVYDGQVEPYADLAIGRLDGVLLDRPIAVTVAAPDARLRLVGAVGAPGTYAIALRPDDEATARALDDALAASSRDGELRTILERWHLWDEDQAALARELEGAPVAPPSDAAPSTLGPSRYVPLLLAGAALTVVVSVLSMGLAVALALPIAAARLWGGRALSGAATAYVELFRGVPVLLVLYFLYYGLPTIGLELDAHVAAVIGFGLVYAAYEAEVYRAAIGSVPEGQWEAAAALGMSPLVTFRRIIAPQALRVALPPMTTDFVALFKDTSLVSVIAVVELTKQYLILSKSTGQYLEIGALTAALYLGLSLPLGWLARRLEARLHKEAT